MDIVITHGKSHGRVCSYHLCCGRWEVLSIELCVQGHLPAGSVIPWATFWNSGLGPERKKKVWRNCAQGLWHSQCLCLRHVFEIIDHGFPVAYGSPKDTKKRKEQIKKDTEDEGGFCENRKTWTLNFVCGGSSDMSMIFKTENHSLFLTFSLLLPTNNSLL